MTLSYAFGGNTGQSYDALQRRRAYLEAAQKAGQSAPKTAGEGILNGLNSVFSDLMLRKLGKQEDANREAANQKALDLFGQPSQYGGGGASVPAYVPPDPNSPSQLGHDTMVALGKAPATPTKDEMSAYIAAKATELGIDPSVAVAVANSEGLNANPAEGWQSRVVKNGQREPSYGPFQLYMGGGLGNNFLEQTGLDPRDPTTWQKQVDFALGHAKNNGWGSWYGARNAGIGDFQGIGGQPQGASGIDPKIVAAMSDPNVSPEIKSALGVLLQQRIAAGQPTTPIEINNKLVDPKTGQIMGDYSDPKDPKPPETKNIKLADGSDVMVQWNPQTGVWEPAKIPEGGSSGAPPGKLTEFQSRIKLFQNMQTETQPVLTKLESQWDPANLSDPAAASIPIAGNYFTSPEYQIYSTAASAWAEGALRISTGAAATQPEIERVVGTYFAKPGDTPATVAFKTKMREMYARSIEAGQGLTPEGKLPDPNEFLKGVSPPPQPAANAKQPAKISGDAEYNALPSGATFIGPDGVTRRKP